MATIRDVARQSGVSIATVSYVLNDGPRPVRPETRQRVLRAIAALDYHPNAMARSLARRRANTLCVLFGLVEPAIVTNPYAAAVLQGILTAAAEAGLNVTLATERWQEASCSAAAFQDRRADGLLLVAPPIDSDMLPTLAGLDLPVVVVSSPAEAFGLPAIDVDNHQGARLAAGHLLSLGHRRIAYLPGDANLASACVRRDAFLETLWESSIQPPAEYLPPGRYENENGYRRACALLSLPEPPTAIFAGNDVLAFAAMRAARDLGWRVPEDLSVIGFDDIPAAAMVTPPLTTVRQPLARIGEMAVCLLIERMEGRPVPPVTRYLTPEMVLRSSTTSPVASARAGAQVAPAYS